MTVEIKPVCDISFKEKVRVFSKSLLMSCAYISGYDAPKNVFTKKLYSKLVSSSRILEDYLDFHGAKSNRDWYFYRELTAAVRHLSLSGYAQKHILNRLNHYNLPDSEDFEKEGLETLGFITKTLMKLSPVILEEADRLGIEIPSEAYDASDFPGIVTGERLESDLDDIENDSRKENIVKLASEYLGIANHFERFTFYQPYSYEEILEIVPVRLNEVEIRRHEMMVHNLQSYFDTYVIHGGISANGENLKKFRSFFSVVYHLMKMMGRLLHFYERHIYEAGFKDIHKSTRERLWDIVDPFRLLDRSINYGLYYVCFFLTTSKDLVREILNENIERSAVTVAIPMKRGFHSRPSLLVAKIVQHYGGQVELRVGQDRFDASSVLDLQWAGGKILNENILEVVFEGDTRALRDIMILASANYGEDTMGKGLPLPKELRYLRE